MSDFSVPNSKPGKCAKCNGTGVFRFGGAVVNGKFIGKSGPCWSCAGTGHQTRSDIHRNVAYNRHKLSSMAEGFQPAAVPTGKACNCGSGEPRQEVNDARGIFVAFVCSKCRARKLKGYRRDIFTDPNYPTTEPID